MVGKLMKHEFKAVYRVLLWFMLAVVLLGALARVCFEINEYTEGLDFAMSIGATLSTSFVITVWFLGALALCYAGVILCLVRYFKSLFTGEGYLTFSLPVTPTQLLVSKLLASFVMTAGCVLTVALSVVIALPFHVWGEFGNVLDALLPQLSALISSEPIAAVELVLLGIASLPSGLLFLFLIASVGQLFTKGRVAITVGLYFGVSFVLEVIFLVFFFPVIFLEISMHIVLWAAIAILLAFDVGSFILIRYLLMYKVNLVV